MFDCYYTLYISHREVGIIRLFSKQHAESVVRCLRQHVNNTIRISPITSENVRGIYNLKIRKYIYKKFGI